MSLEMDVPSPRPGSTTLTSGFGHQTERPLPPIPDPEPSPISWDNERATDVSRSSISAHTQEHVDVSDIYAEDIAVEGQGVNLHGGDGSFLGAYPSRSSSSLSVYAPEELTRSPYLERVSNHSSGPSFVIDDHSTSPNESPDGLRSAPREVTAAAGDLGPVSLREFLGDAPSTLRSGSASFAEAPAMTSKSAVYAPTSTGDSATRSRRPQGRPHGALWEQSEPRSNASLSIGTPSHRSRHGSDDESSSSGSFRDSPLLSHTSPSVIRHRQQQQQQLAEFIVPRWQPDAEVTFCPICRTQFNFFVRKHHCRKCGRVVCNSCSPHRITIPYQYIVQPPTDSGESPTSPDPHPNPRTDAASSSGVTSLGGGERVRLCNPCVPDPNTAPPVSRQRPASYQSHHSRSASTTAVPLNAPPGAFPSNEAIRASLGNFQRRPQQPSILGNSNRYSDSQNQSRGTSYNERGDRLLRPDDLQSRSRSSTVGSSREQTLGPYPNTSNPNTSLERTHSIRGHPQYRSLIPNTQSDQYPTMRPRPRPTPRRQIAEVDECWICHIELPPRDLPNFQALREAHTQACLEAALQGVSLSPAPAFHLSPPRGTIPSQIADPSSQERPGFASSSSTPVPTANTPEARTAAREQAHAAIVLGRHRPSPGPRRLNGGTIFPYKASEKDLIQDAECSICFDEYVVGQDMGRLECFCRFHLQCIQDWYEKEPGRCPVHDHNHGA